MKLHAPCQSIDFLSNDLSGKPFQLSGYLGKPVILSFFRDAACPFCNMRVYEFTKKYQEWSALGIEVVAVFSSPSEQVAEFVARHPRPFMTIGDPELKIYQQYGIEHSRKGFYRALMLKIPRIVGGLIRGGRPDVRNPNRFIVPADFLIGPNGKIVDLWYGKDVADHIPMKRIEKFARRVKAIREKQALRMVVNRH